MEVKNHRLEGENVQPFVKATATFSAIVPDTVIIHYTAGPSGDATVKLFANPATKTSAHLVVHEDGRITQMVDFNKMAAHAGESSWGGRTSFNKFSIGIEISNPGYLVKNTKGSGFVTWWEANRPTPKPVQDAMIFTGKHRNKITTMTQWYIYPEVQIKAVFDACEAICKAYGIKFILGHEEIAPGRKTDPGPAFPLDDLRNKLLPDMTGVTNTSTTTKTDTVEEVEKERPKEQLMSMLAKSALVSGAKMATVSTLLNIRVSPDANAALACPPIPQGSSIQILSEKGDWYNVLHPVNGWVFREYVNQDNSDETGDAEVTVDSLNIRVKPDPNSEKAAEPLKKGAKVHILNQQDHWYNVVVKVNGWVMKKYVMS